MKLSWTAILAMAAFLACRPSAADEHAHDAQGGHSHEEGLQALSYTLYSAQSELFVEFQPLIAGRETRFAAHLTRLGDSFTPYLEGSVTVSLIQGSKGIRQTADGPSSPGIFRLGITPEVAGPGKLVFDIRTSDFTDQFIIEDLTVFADEAAAIAAAPSESAGNAISYLKEQAWKVEFANAPVTRTTMHDVIRATGELQHAPGEEIILATKSNGIVRFAGPNIIIGSAVRAGQALFTVTGGEIAFENVEAARASAAAERATAQTEFSRAEELFRSRLITQAEYETARLRLEQAQITVSNLEKNYDTGKNVLSPINGYMHSLRVKEGEFVQAGQPLAAVSTNRQIVLKADVSLKDASLVNRIEEANFIVTPGRQVYNTRDLQARILSVGQATSAEAPFVPVHFIMKRPAELLPGSFAEVFLKTAPIPDALVLPASAIMEEQGVYYTYVQTAGESFEKRELTLGAHDGQHYQVLAGLTEGERVVTKGAYQIKLSQASGTLPAHGHSH